MANKRKTEAPRFGSADLRLPDELRAPLKAHLEALREGYRKRNWGGRVGFGKRPAMIVIDLALWWTDPRSQSQGSDVDSVVEAACRLLKAARAARIPIIFTTWDWDPAMPPSPHDRKLKFEVKPGEERWFELDPRLKRRPGERILTKRYASAFKGTNLHDTLAGLGVDTLIVTGVSTSHCVYATCRDATDSFRVIVPREAVGERCEIMHEVNLLDIDIDLADVVPLVEVERYLGRFRRKQASR
ncbi:MAG TPA: isochorismatase family protein [Bryobacteraceae bacterium]|nr:isochorismatase family protein [Bryobacteraceae bacterium]